MLNQCQKIGDVAYMIDWYRLLGKKKLCCILIIAMSNMSIKFTAGNMVELSISTFSDVRIKLLSLFYSNLQTNENGLNEQVVKTSMAFLNMLRALT